MARFSPLSSRHAQAEASIARYGSGGDGSPDGVELVATFGDLNLEYASLRKHCVIFDQPHRGVLELEGADRLEFLNRMVTQELRNLPPFSARHSFWLNRKGRIDADLRIIDLPERTLIDVDIHAAARAAETLASFIVTEDATLRDISEKTHRLALHGPTAIDLVHNLAAPAEGSDASGPAFGELEPRRACVVKLAGHSVVIDRDDSAGEIGLELTMSVDAARDVYDYLLTRASLPDEPGGGHREPNTANALANRIRLRESGWHAYNMARIEAGTAIYYLDFGPDSLPAESGVMEDRVSLKKGCYLGQEIVARMHARGHPKQVLVALKPAGRADQGTPQPATGGQIFAQPDSEEAVGAVTSSTLAIMLGAIPVCFAQVKWEHREPGTTLFVEAEGTRLEMTVQPQLRFWPRPPDSR